MYNNITKHSILNSLNSVRIRDNEFTDSFISTDLVYDVFRTGRPPLWRKDEFDLAVINLEKEGFLIRKSVLIGSATCFTAKGIAALTDNKFINDNTKIFLNGLKDYIILICNVLIAIAAIIALNKNSENNKVEYKHLETRLDSISQTIKRDTLVILVKPPISTLKKVIAPSKVKMK